MSYRFDRATQAAILTIIGTGPVDWVRRKGRPGGRYFRLPGRAASTRPQRRPQPQRRGAPGAVCRSSSHYDY